MVMRGPTGRTADQFTRADHSRPVEPLPNEPRHLFKSGSTGTTKGAVDKHAKFGAQAPYIRSLYGTNRTRGPGDFSAVRALGPGREDGGGSGDGASRPEKRDRPIARRSASSASQHVRLAALIDRSGARQCAGHQAADAAARDFAGAPRARGGWNVSPPSIPARAIFTPYGATECMTVASIGSARS